MSSQVTYAQGSVRDGPLRGVGGVEAAGVGQAGEPVVDAVGVEMKLGRGQPSVAVMAQIDAQGVFPVRVPVQGGEPVQEQLQCWPGAGQLVLDEYVFEVVHAGGTVRGHGDLADVGALGDGGRDVGHGDECGAHVQVHVEDVDQVLSAATTPWTRP